MQAEEASCSSDSGLSQLQMGQLEDDEKLWVQVLNSAFELG